MTYAIETNHLSKNYGPVCAIKDVNLRVKPGEVYGFLGLNGAGKTTTIRALLGMIRPSAGNVKVLGQALGAGGRGPDHSRRADLVLRGGRAAHRDWPGQPGRDSVDQAQTHVTPQGRPSRSPLFCVIPLSTLYQASFSYWR